MRKSLSKSVHHINGGLPTELGTAIREQYQRLHSACTEPELQAVELIATLAANSIQELHVLMAGMATVEIRDGEDPLWWEIAIDPPAVTTSNIIARLVQEVR